MRRFKRTATIAALLLPGLGVIVGFISIVIYFAFAQSFGQFGFRGDDRWTLDFWRELGGDDTFRRSFVSSLRVATLSALFSIALAYPVVMWLRTPFRGSNAMSAILKIPLLIPGLVAAFLYVNFISFNGFFNHILQRLGIIDSPLRIQNDDWGIGVLILQTWKQMPFALLLLTGAVRSIGDDIFSAARDVGAGAWKRFGHVVLPLTLASMQAAMIIIFIGAAGDFSFQVVAGPRAPFSMAQYMNSVRTTGSDRNYAAVVGVMLMVLSLVGSLTMAGLARLAVNRRSYK